MSKPDHCPGEEVSTGSETAAPVVVVRMGQYEVLRDRGVLVALGLGSCVGVAIYDSVNRVAGLAHVFLPDSSAAREKEGIVAGKYADLAVPALLKSMIECGAVKVFCRVTLAGGAQILRSAASGVLDVGSRNVAAVKQALAAQRVEIVRDETGADYGRSMRFYVDSGHVEITNVKSVLRKGA